MWYNWVKIMRLQEKEDKKLHHAKNVFNDEEIRRQNLPFVEEDYFIDGMVKSAHNNMCVRIRDIRHVTTRTFEGAFGGSLDRRRGSWFSDQSRVDYFYEGTNIYSHAKVYLHLYNYQGCNYDGDVMIIINNKNNLDQFMKILMKKMSDALPPVSYQNKRCSCHD